MVFNTPLLFVKMTMLQMLLAGLIILNNDEERTTWRSWICFGIPSLYLVSSIAVLCVPIQKLRSDSSKEIYGALYSQLSLAKKSNLGYLLAFGIRIALLCATIVFMQPWQGMQLLGLMYFNLFHMIIVAYIKPFINRSTYRLELLNDSCIYLSCIVLSTFSDYFDAFEEQYMIGWFYIALVSLCILINLYNMVHVVIRFL
jgi:hypothetical protein